jgi:hypothetical protein
MNLHRLPQTVHQLEAMFDHTSLELLATMYPSVLALRPVDPTLQALKRWSWEVSTKAVYAKPFWAASFGGSYSKVKGDL